MAAGRLTPPAGCAGDRQRRGGGEGQGGAESPSCRARPPSYPGRTPNNELPGARRMTAGADPRRRGRGAARRRPRLSSPADATAAAAAAGCCSIDPGTHTHRRTRHGFYLLEVHFVYPSPRKQASFVRLGSIAPKTMGERAPAARRRALGLRLLSSSRGQLLLLLLLQLLLELVVP